MVTNTKLHWLAFVHLKISERNWIDILKQNTVPKDVGKYLIMDGSKGKYL